MKTLEKGKMFIKKIKNTLRKILGQGEEEQMHPQLQRAIENGTTPYSKHSAVPENYVKDASTRQFSHWVQRIKNSPLNTEKLGFLEIARSASLAVGKVMEIEREEREYLERLAITLIRQAYGIKQGEIEFDAKLIVEIDVGESSQYRKLEKKGEPSEDIASEVEKRRLINSLIQGAGTHGESLMYMAKDELEGIYPGLVHMYDLIMSLSHFTYWKMPDEVDEEFVEALSQMASGTERIDLSGSVPKIIARAVLFPVLLQELAKGVVELVSMHGLPKEGSKMREALKYTDTIQSELWSTRLGKDLWNKVLRVIDSDDPRILMKVYEKIVSLQPEQFHRLMKEVLGETPNGRAMVQQLIKSVQ